MTKKVLFSLQVLILTASLLAQQDRVMDRIDAGRMSMLTGNVR